MAAFAWGLLALIFASVGPVRYVPRVFYSYHVEHFAAFYVIAVLATAGLPKFRLIYIALSLAVTAVALETVRLAIPPHQHSSLPDLVADLSGLSAAVVPILVGQFRKFAAGGAP